MSAGGRLARQVEECPAVLRLELDELRLELLEAWVHIAGPEAREALKVPFDAGP